MTTAGKTVISLAWVALTVFIGASFASVAYAKELLHAKPPLGVLGICGNCISDPICLVLSYGVPLVVGMNALVGYSSARGVVSSVHVRYLLTVSVMSVSVFIWYSVHFFHWLFGKAPILKGVWWIAPFL
jgi:hypothetical protein